MSPLTHTRNVESDFPEQTPTAIMSVGVMLNHQLETTTVTTQSCLATMETREDDEPPRKRTRLTECRNSEFQSALMLAVLKEREDVVEKLLVLDPSQVHRQYDRQGRNVLHYCALAKPSMAARVAGRLLRLRREGRMTSQTAAGLRAALMMPDGSWRTPMQTAAVADALGSARVLALLALELREPLAINIDAADVVRSEAWRMARWLRETGQLASGLIAGVAMETGAAGERDGWESLVGVADAAADSDDVSGPGAAAAAVAADWGGAEEASSVAMSHTEMMAFCAALSTRCPPDALPALCLLPLMTSSTDPVWASRWILGRNWRQIADEARRAAAESALAN